MRWPADAVITCSSASRPSTRARIARSAYGSQAWPASVRRIPWGVRRKSFTRSSCSSAWSRAVSVGWVMNSASAARLTLPRRATSRKPSTWSSWNPPTRPLRLWSMATVLRTHLIYIPPRNLRRSTRLLAFMSLFFGFHMPNFTFAEAHGPALFDRVVENALAAEAAGFDLVTVMDHFYQIRGVGPETEPMLESYTALGALAAKTS